MDLSLPGVMQTLEVERNLWRSQDKLRRSTYVILQLVHSDTGYIHKSYFFSPAYWTFFNLGFMMPALMSSQSCLAISKIPQTVLNIMVFSVISLAKPLQPRALANKDGIRHQNWCKPFITGSPWVKQAFLKNSRSAENIVAKQRRAKTMICKNLSRSRASWVVLKDFGFERNMKFSYY